MIIKKEFPFILIVQFFLNYYDLFFPVSPAPKSSESPEFDHAEGNPQKSAERKDDKCKLVVGAESEKAINKSDNTLGRSKNVPHTYLTMPDGKRLFNFYHSFELPNETSPCASVKF